MFGADEDINRTGTDLAKRLGVHRVRLHATGVADAPDELAIGVANGSEG